MSHVCLHAYIMAQEESLSLYYASFNKYAEDAEDDEEDSEKSFDYTFDYIVCPTSPKPLSEIAEQQGVTERKLETTLPKNGYTLARRHGRT